MLSFLKRQTLENGRVAIGFCVMALAGCTINPTPADTSGLTGYPYEIESVRVVDVEVFRDGTKITLANHAPESFADFTLWINERYQAKVDALPLGGMLTISLDSLRDEFGEKFRAGGFFSSQKAQPVVKAEMQSTDSLIGLIVIPNDKYGP